MSEIILSVAAVIGVLVGWPLGCRIAEWQFRRQRARARTQETTDVQ